MKTIYKYELDLADRQSLSLPQGFEILSIQVQHGVPCLWARVDSNEFVTAAIRIHCYGTGHDLPSETELKFIDTIQMAEGKLIFHFFEEVVG